MNELKVLESKGREMKAIFEHELNTVAAHIYRRGVSILPSVECLSGGRLWQKRRRILFAVTFTSPSDLPTIRQMLDEFLKEYLSEPENQKVRVRICFLTTSNGGEAHERVQ